MTSSKSLSCCIVSIQILCHLARDSCLLAYYDVFATMSRGLCTENEEWRWLVTIKHEIEIWNWFTSLIRSSISPYHPRLLVIVTRVVNFWTISGDTLPDAMDMKWTSFNFFYSYYVALLVAIYRYRLREGNIEAPHGVWLIMVHPSLCRSTTAPQDSSVLQNSLEYIFQLDKEAKALVVDWLTDWVTVEE